MQATNLHTQDAVLLLHPRTGGCCEILREKSPFTTSTPFDEAEVRKELYTLCNMIAMTIWTLIGCMLIVSQTVWQHKLRSITDGRQHHYKHIRDKHSPSKNTKIRKCTEMTCSLASHTIALSFIYPMLHWKLLQTLDCLLWDRLVSRWLL